MDISKDKIKELTQKIATSKMNLLMNNGFFGVLLFNMKFSLSNEVKESCGIATDGDTIYFNPIALDNYSQQDVDILIMHVLLHIALKHTQRQHNHEDSLWHRACDIVVNSNLMESLGTENGDLYVRGRKLEHLTPNNHEGRDYSVEEVYEMLLKNVSIKKSGSKEEENSFDDIDSEMEIDGYDYEGPPPGKVVGQLYSDRNARIYLKEDTYGDYYSSHELQFYHAPKIDPSQSMHLDMMLKDLQENLTHVRYSFIDSSVRAYPEYLSAFGIYKNVNEYDCYPIVLTDKFNKYIQSHLKEYEKDIDKNDIKNNIYLNYLGLDDKIIKFFDSINVKNIISKDKNILINIRNYIATAARYDIHFPSPQIGEDFVIHFLRDSKRGVCMHFAVAAMCLYRYFGIPARYVSGYLVKSRKDEDVEFRNSDSHAWVEVYIDNVGWVYVDPTPVSASGSSGGGNGSGSRKGKNKQSGNGGNNGKEKDDKNQHDDHSKWGKSKNKDEDPALKEAMLNNRITEAFEIASHRQEAGKIPGIFGRIVGELKNPRLDWRVYLNNFIQENIVDYSFCPPDKRFSDSDFLLPDFNDPEDVVKNVLFMIDTSGSISDAMIRDCFSEIQGAINQFNGKLEGYVGFFDAVVQKVIKFDEDTDIMSIKSLGGGGTNFSPIFRYVKEKMQDNLPVSIVILTDGYADWPSVDETMGIPVLWVINNKIQKPPFGKVARILD